MIGNFFVAIFVLENTTYSALAALFIFGVITIIWVIIQVGENHE
jgi:hypothetical protein